MLHKINMYFMTVNFLFSQLKYIVDQTLEFLNRSSQSYEMRIELSCLVTHTHTHAYVFQMIKITFTFTNKPTSLA